MVEVPHGHSPSVMGGSGDLEQAKKAINDAPLQRIKMDYPRKEECGLQKGGISTYGESSKSEMSPDSRTSLDM